MHLPCHRSTTRRLGTLAAAFLVAGMASTSAFAESDIDKEVDMLAKLPDAVFNTYAPDSMKEGNNASVNGSGSFAGAQPAVPLDGVEVTFQQVVPEIAYPFITGVTFDGSTPTIEFEVLDQFGFGIEGMANSFRFYANKLIPRSNGLPPAWQGYNLTSDDGVENAYPTSVRDGTFTDLGDGNYSFAFDQGLEEFSGIMFEPELTHRFGVELRGAEIVGVDADIEDGSDNAFDIVPATGATEGIVSREIVVQEACTACHGPQGEFGFHGGPRQDVKQCVSCHQAGAFDGTTKNSIDLGVMLHAIHSASDTYSVDRGRRGVFTFEDVGYPQSVSNCVTCHDPENEATPQAINIANAPSAEMCASCHNDLAFDDNGLTNENRNHLGLAQPNSTCAACHSENGLMVSSLEEHFNEAVAAAQQIQFVIGDITNTGEGQSPVVKFWVINPDDGSFYDLETAVAFNGDATSFNMTFAWPTTDYTNVSNDEGTDILGRTGGRSASYSLASDDGLSSDVIVNGDGTYTLDTSLLSEPLVVPTVEGGLGSGLVSLEGHPAADFNLDGVADDRLAVTSVVKPFAINDPQPVMRRQIVDVAKCQDCHGENDGLAFHGANRVDEVQHCVTCHHPNATDIRGRSVDPDGIANGINTAEPDGKESESVDMGYMIHALHAGGDYYAGGLAAADIHYPRSIGQCSACHVDEDSYALPLPSTNLGITVETGATVGPERRQFIPSEAVARNPKTDNNISPAAAACVSCHSSDIAKQHIAVRSESGISFGNSFLLNPDPVADPDTQARLDAAPAENCAFCHGTGAFAEAHGG